ncbi:MAG: type II toxin-antitoxin system HicB family antitoxin [Acidimicrobiia bacterium]|nr:type II toxin-antitoxin system HicB family antitoxin [bacterium]MXZ07133.1 type II toxin-antitoxin system HicB family antitoxin [Acidimicrobiia bacterium]MYK55073.1 type II toxin-antitoxin system HicB family antitoxin [Acidimicrobiia bacterium]
MQEKQLTAVVRQEDGWFIAQALEVDVASQGKSPNVALDNLAEALELHFEPPRPTALPAIHHLQVKVGAA